MTTYRDIESANLEGLAKFEAWRDQWEAEFLEPLIIDGLRRKLQTMITPDMMLQLYAQDKDTFKNLAEFLGAGGE